MKAMIVSDFAVLRSAILQLLGICAIIALFMGYAMGTLVGGAAAIAAMPPFMLLFSLAATDEQNGWERFRLTLPLTRRQNPPAALVGSVVGAVGVITPGMAVTLPLVFRFGMTRATRFVPVVVVIAIACGIGFFDAGIQPTGVLADLVQWLDTGSNDLFLAAALVAVVALIYVASAFVAAKLYEKREF